VGRGILGLFKHPFIEGQQTEFSVDIQMWLTEIDAVHGRICRLKFVWIMHDFQQANSMCSNCNNRGILIPIESGCNIIVIIAIYPSAR